MTARNFALRGTAYGATLLVLAISFLGIAHSYVLRYGLRLPATAGILVCFYALLALVLLPAFVQRETGIGPGTVSVTAALSIPLLCCSPYLIYALATGDLRLLASLKLMTISGFVFGIYASVPVRTLSRLAWQDAAVALLLIGFVLSGQLKGIWNIPVNLDFMSRLFLIAVASWCWTFVRPVPALGYRFRITSTVLEHAALNFLSFAAIAIPLGLALGFTAWHPRWRGIGIFTVDYLEIFLFIALLEELFFRGFLQSLLSASLKNWIAAQLIVSCLFGLFHILHAPFPNWRHVILASIAGWFYGSTYRKTNSVFASALVHAGVDTVWRTWLTAH